MKKVTAILLAVALLSTVLSGCGIVESIISKVHDEVEDALEKELTLPTDALSFDVGLNQYTATVPAGMAFQLSITGVYMEAHWSSSNESVALVNSQGTVSGVSAGIANIVCTVDGKELSCTVTVTDSVQTTAPTAPAAPVSDFIFPHSSTAYLTESEIAAKLATCTGYSPGKDYAQDAINEIYARNGYIFKTAEVLQYYQAKSWYTPDANFTDAQFNVYEKHNIALLEKF